MRLLVAVALVLGASGAALGGPLPPCGAPPTPPFGNLDGPPQWRIWSADELRAERWQPAGCLGWSGDTRLVAAVASRFRSRDDVFQRLVNVAAWPSIRYWSVSRQSWQPLALSISAVTGAPGASAAVVAASLAPGGTYQFTERDEHGGDIVYSLRVLQHDAAHLTVATENVTPIRIAIVTAFPPGALQTVTFLERAGADQWNTYQITRVGADASSLVLGYPGSFLNRLEAVRRYLASQPPDQLPPLAPR
jgi:uncharacterized protein DUF6675